MSELIKLFLSNILRPVFEDPQLIEADLLSEIDLQELPDQTTSGEDDNQLDGPSQVSNYDENNWDDARLNKRLKKGPSSKASLGKPLTRRRRKTKTKRNDRRGMLDPSGPKLINGLRSWLLLYQITGQINWLGVPFFLSLIYKVSLLSLVVYVALDHFVKPLLNSNIVDSNYRNPIFIFIGALAFLTTLLHAALSIYSNLFELCPLFKVLTTPRLCFIKEEIQHMAGSKSLLIMLLFHIYQCTLLHMLGLKDLNEFFYQFHVGRFMVDSFVVTCLTYLFVGTMHIDFYVRFCFGFWIIAMKRNLEYRSAYLQRHRRLGRFASSSTVTNAHQLLNCSPTRGASVSVESCQMPGQHQKSSDLNRDVQVMNSDRNEIGQEAPEEEKYDNGSLGTDATISTAFTNHVNNKQQQQQQQQHTKSQSLEQMNFSNFKEKYKLDTMDEIQKNLNTMDDHLEVCRGIQNGSLFLITLNAFLTNGALLLLAYNLLANQGKYYHGFILVLIATNNSIFVFFCYFGESWISYALGSFVQTVEDEYFVQGGDNSFPLRQPLPSPKDAPADEMTEEAANAASESTRSVELIELNQSLFLIKKKDVLFCREFLHQFKNHLATPWSKLTVKIHLHVLRTFVTLIAAQIIFDREH